MTKVKVQWKCGCPFITQNEKLKLIHQTSGECFFTSKYMILNSEFNQIEKLLKLICPKQGLPISKDDKIFLYVFNFFFDMNITVFKDF